MEGVEDERRSQKLQAGREKLAHFRQRKTKGETSKAQKKQQKRKSKAVHTNDVSNEDTLGKVDYAKTDPVMEAEDVTSEPKQMTVSDWEESITQSSNEQKALSGKEVEDETLSLSSRIHAIQSQLQNASKVLKDEGPGKTELYEAELQLSLLQRSFMSQAERMSHLDQQAQELERELEHSRKKTKENENQLEKRDLLMKEQQSRLEFLQEKLEKSENSVSLLQQELFSRNPEMTQPKHEISIQTESLLTSIGSDLGGGGDSTLKANEMDTATLATLIVELKERLAESETLRESLRTKIKEQMLAFEVERSSWEQKHNDMVTDLALKLQQAEQIVAQEKHEKDHLNQELRDLKNNLRLEVEGSEAIKQQHDRCLQMYDMKLRSLEEDNTNLNQQSFSTWKLQDSEDCSQEIFDLKKTGQDTRVDHFRHELEDLKKNLSKVKARKELEDSKAVELDQAEDEVAAPALTSLDKYLIPNQMFDNGQEDSIEHSKFELDSDFILDQSMNSTMGGNINILSSPMPITGVLAGGLTLGTLLDPESFAVYLSSNTKPSEKAERSPELVEDLSQKCSALMERLQDKEEQLQKTSEALAEALQKWRDVTAELVDTKLEMEKVFKKGCSEEQLRIVEEITSERDDLRNRITDQEQLLKEVQEQKSMKDEYLSLLTEEKSKLENRLSIVEKKLENTVELCKNLDVRNHNLDQNLQNLEIARESERQEFDNKLNSKGVEQQLLEDAIREKETEFYQREENLREEMSLLRREKEQLENKLQQEVNRLNAEFEKRMDVSGESWREQIAALNQAHESQITLLQSNYEDLQKVCSDLKTEKQKLEELVQQLEKAHSIEMAQTQSAHNVEMEAMRLSLNNLHTAHLELSQSNLLKEKENALLQLRDQLNNKWSQDLAILQSKNQFEVEHLREVHRQALESLREELSKEISRHQQEHLKEIELLKENHATEGLELEERYKKELESMQKMCEEQRVEFERKSEELRLMEEESLVKLSNLQELHILEKEEILNLHLEERNRWEVKQDELSQQLKVSLEGSDLCGKEVLNLEEQNAKGRTEMKETNSKQLEEIEQVQNELSTALKQNEELARQIESLSERRAVEESKLRDHKKDLESLDHDHYIESQENKPFQELEQLKQELSQMTELHSHQTDQLQQKHSDEILLLQDSHSKEVTELQDLLALEKQEWGRQQEEHAKKMLQLQMQCENLENNHLQEKNEWEKQIEQQSEILKRLNKETVQLQDEHSKAIKQLQEKHDKEIEEIKELHILEKEEWEKQRDQHSQELDLLVNQHSQELKRIGEELLQNSLEKQEEHAKQLEQIQEECAKQILELQQQHLVEIQKMNDLYMQENPDWKKQANQYFQQMQSSKPLLETAPQDSCTHQELLKNGICLIDEIHAKENIVLEQCKQHSEQIHHAGNLNLQEDVSELMEEHKVHGLQDQQGKQTEASDLSESSHQQHKAFLPDANEDLAQVYPQQNEILDEYVQSQINYSEVKIKSSEEIQLLWSQVDGSRASRQELHELKQQLIARSTQLEEIERMRKNFEQERIMLKAEHEKEMEELRIYFEQKSSSAEETYREELEILHQRLKEMNDDEKVEMTPLNCSSLTLEESFESEKLEFLQRLTDQLEEHKEDLAFSRLHIEEGHKQELENLRAALSLHYKEDVLNLKMDLSEKYTSEIDSLKKKHCLDLEKLRARLSEEHIREITRMQLQNTHKAMKPGENIENAEVLGDDGLTLGAKWHSDGDVKNSEPPSSIHHPLLKKRVKMCQTDFESGSKSCDEKKEQDDGEKKEQDDSEIKSQLEVLQAKELVCVREKMANDLEEITNRLKEEKEHALKEVEERIAQVHTENAKLQKALLRETLIKPASAEYQEAGNDDPSVQLGESLISGVSEEKHNLESGDIDLIVKAPNVEKTTVLSELCPTDDPNPGFSEIQSHHGEPYVELAELLKKHQEELYARALDYETHIQSLEASHLIKLDSLESSYLLEIQKIRDEHALAVEELEQCLLHRLQEKEKEAQDQLEQSRVQWLQQQEQELERLRQELASIQLAKFQEMAKELQVAHEEDLKLELDQQLFQIEEEKKQALNVLQEEVLRMEAQNQLALQELRDLHKVEVENQTIKLQEELKKTTEELHKRELVIVELTSERQALSTNQQGQSDQQLRYQDEIEMLKCQSEMLLEQQIGLLKEEFLAEKKSALQELEERFRRDLEKVRAEHQMEKDRLMKQLEDKNTEVSQLQDKVSSITKDMAASQSQMDVLVQRRERENQEGEHLVAMLQSDVHAAQQDRRKLQDSCQRLLKIFADVLKSTLVTEDLISKKIGLCLDQSLSQTDDERSVDNLAKSLDKNRLSPDCETMTEHSLMSSDEGYDLSEYLCDSVLGSLEVGLENEEKIVRMGHRLRAAVERLLDMVTDSALQLEQTREMQKCFEDEFKSGNQDMAQVVIQNQELLKQLSKETEEKNQLQLELHKSQGLIDGFALEKAALEEALVSKEGSEHRLAVELEKSREQVKILTQEPCVSGKEKEVLQRLQEVLSDSDIDAELLKETERLLKEELELHCQAKQDRSNLISQMKMLEMELEEQMSRNQELMRKTNVMTDLQQQIQSLEKQLKSQRQFMDEQAMEREHERDEFQQEIQKLEEQLKQALKGHGDSKAHGIETLEARVKEKTDDCKLLLQGREHLEQQITERNEEIDKMMIQIQALEQAVLSNADAAKKCSVLEAELQKMQKIEKEIMQDKEALEQQQFSNVLQISALQTKLDEARHRVPVEGDPNPFLKQELQAEREALQRKEKEAESLVEQLEQFREELMNKTEEVFQLNMQLDVQRKQYERAVQQAQEEYLRLKDEVSTMHSRKSEDGASSTLQLPQALLQEKNQEIDHLNEQILRLQQEATCSESAEMEELRSLVELLRSDLERLRKDKEEEIEQLHEVIEKLQKELEQLGPNRHEISDSQESLDQLGFGEVENLQRELRKGAKKLQGEGREDTEHTRGTELEALQQELEEKVALHITEIEVLERNLHNVQQSCRQHEQALESLQVQHRNLQEESELLWSRFSEREEQIASLSSQLQELQDRLREKDGFLMDKELLVQTMQEQNAADLTEHENQLAHSALSLEAAKMDLQKLQEETISLKNVISKCSNEQREREEEYRREIQYLKQLHSDWEEKAKILTEEVQTQTEDEFMELNTLPQLVSLKKQLQTAENLASLREADLLGAQTKLANMKQELEELHAECERREAKAQDVLQQLQKREICVAELQTHSQKLGTQVKKLQDALVSQENMIVLMSGALPEKNLDLKHKPDVSRPGKATSFSESLSDWSTWDSPEMVRKQEEAVHSLGAFTPFSELSIAPSVELIRSKSTSIKRPEHCDLLGSSTPSLSESSFSAQRTSPLRGEGHTDYGSCDDDLRSSRDDQMGSEKSELDYRSELGTKSELNYMENLTDIKQKMDTTGLSPQLQRMLNMVHEESCKILELSERPLVKSTTPDRSALAIKIDTWQKEKQTLQETIQSLSSALAQAADKGEKESTTLDWRRDLLQSVQALLESEREYLRLELQSDIRNDSGDKNLLSEKVERLIKEQEEQKRLVLEHVLAVDRSSLLSEVQDLRSQLRMAHLQNQEKLQKLQDTLTSTEEKGHTREHQLRRQVELLEYKLQQEASIAEDVKGSLVREQERATEQYKLLLQEQAAVSHFRSELEEKALEMESLRKSHKELQKEIHMETSKLREELENKEKTLSAYIKTIETESQAERQRSDREKSHIQRSLEMNERALQEVSLSLEEHKLLNAKMSAAISQEQTTCSNLKKELEIEQSRCKALLAQEHVKLSETVKELGKEKQHSLSLVNTLTVERGVLEQVRQQHAQELSKIEAERQQQHKLVLSSQSELKDERKRARDLAAMIEKTQQQAVHAKRQLESELQTCREEMQKEREAGLKLRALLESLQSQKQQLDSVLDQQRERQLRLQKERDQYQAQVLSLQEKERTWVKELEQQSKGVRQTETSKARVEEQERQIMNLQLQHERDRRRIQELQQMLADLEEQERALASRKSRLWNDSHSPTKNDACLIANMQRVWQQLFHIVLQVKKWVQNKSIGTNEGFPSEAEVTKLLESLSELKSEIQTGYVQPAQSSPGVTDVLKRENEELAGSVSQLTKEKLELRSQLSKLVKTHQESLQKNKDQVHADVVDSVLEAERAVWFREKRLLQVALKHAESELGKATLENRPTQDVPNSKMQRLYRKYLRAESFRKALVYQKKYLLLLIGGFQACEKATLSLIARMGVYPSPADLQIHSKCKTGLGKFRSAVRAVIAISRLKFLVRKWHKVNRKGSSDDSGTRQVPVNRMEVLQQLVGTTLNSPPTRDLPFVLYHSPNVNIGTASLKSSQWTPKWTGQSPSHTHERSRHSSQDPEHSITEYIQHLEMVQRRLGGVQNGPSPEQSRCVKYARK